MNQSILDFLKSQRTAVLAVEMLDGSPHGATVHFANSDNPLVFYFETNKTYRKAEPLFAKEKVRATLVIGTSEERMQTLQMDGTASILPESEKTTYEEIYLGKFPEKKEKSQSPEFVRFTFTPTWWRFTDWTGPQGKQIITSEN